MFGVRGPLARILVLMCKASVDVNAIIPCLKMVDQVALARTPKHGLVPTMINAHQAVKFILLKTTERKLGTSVL